MMNADDLESLLDEALNDFKPPAATPSAAPPPGALPSATTDATTAAAPSLSFDPLAASQSGKKKKKAAKASEDVPEALRDLARGLAQLVEGGMGNEDEVHATLAALEAQTRASTGVGEGGASAPDRDLLEGLDGLDEAGYQALLQQFETMGSDPSMASVLDTFMSQLLSKSVLYEPLQQISLRYPSYLASARGSLPAEQLARYTRQSELVAQLLAVFDHAPEDVGHVMHLMQEMQRCGAPPQEIMSDVAPDLQFGEDGLPHFAANSALPPELTQGCAQQ